jgi:hypothetical protein
MGPGAGIAFSPCDCAVKQGTLLPGLATGLDLAWIKEVRY